MCRKKRTVRGSARWEGWIKGAAVAAADASRWRYQGTDVNGGEVYTYSTCRVLHFARSTKESGRKERSRNARLCRLSMEVA